MNSLSEAVHARQAQRAFRIIDAHAHAGPYSLFFIPRSSSAEMVAVMQRCGVERAILSTNLGIELDARAGNDATAKIVDAHSDRLLGYVVVNPWQDPDDEIARRATDPRFVGIKVHPDLHHYPLTGARYRSVWEFAERTGRPVLTHSWFGSDYDDLAHVAAVADRHPLARILIGHAGVRREGLDAAIALARTHANTYLEICGSHWHGALIARMVGEAGPGRVVYGSDFPFIDMRTSLGRVAFASLGDAETAMVLGGNISKLIPQLSD